MQSLQPTDSPLARPFTFPCGRTAANRVAKGAMTEQLAAARDNLPNTRIDTVYSTWASSGTGVLLTGNILVDRRHLEGPYNVVVDRDHPPPLAPFRRWADAVHAAPDSSALLLAQLSHPGRQTPMSCSIEQRPLSPSGVPLNTPLLPIFQRPVTMTAAQIEDIIDRFVFAATFLDKAGFDGVQVHSAHGYLGSQFLSPLTNKRTDRWGGSIENRARFLCEVVTKVRAATRPDFVISVKLNSADFQRGGFDHADATRVITLLEQLGAVDLLEISGGNYETGIVFTGNGGKAAASSSSSQKREAYFLGFAETVRETTKLPLMVTGGFRSRECMEEALRSGVLDFVGVARPFCLDPHWLPKMLAGQLDRVPEVDVRLGIKALDMGLDPTWHGCQIHRLADGKDPDFGLGRAYILTVLTFDRFVYNTEKSGLAPLVATCSAVAAAATGVWWYLRR